MIDLSDRKSVQEFMLINSAQALSREQYARFKAGLEAMPDDMFWQVIAECIATAPKNCGYKEQAKLLDEVRNANGITSKNSAMHDLQMHVISDEEADRVWKRIIASRPSDEIKLTGDEDSRLIKLWEKGTEDVSIPSDLFFANTIPLLDCRIIVDETCRENGHVVPYRVVVFPDYAELIQLAEENEPVNVGAIVNNPVIGPCCFTPFYVVKGVDSIMFSGVGYHGVPEENIRKAQATMTMQDLSQMAISFLETWYGIQIALLHPTMREMFRHPKTAPDTKYLPVHSTKRKNRVKYIKVHIINSDEMNAAMFGESKTYTRHALVWYVIGHWRTIKSGVKVFIKPCWKGPLRDVKVTLAERERVIVQATGGAL
jgi:hypothetical protein